MLQNYLKIALRNLVKNKVFSVTNIAGLTIGMACSLLMWLYVKHESNYDTFVPDAENIRRVVKDFVNDDGTRLPDATTPPALAPVLPTDIPEIVTSTRLYPAWNQKFLIKYGEKRIFEDNLWRADTSFFQFFNIPFVKGNAQSAFKEINNIVLTEKMAERYFGQNEALGKVLEVENLGTLTVSAIVKEMPSNAHFHFDFIISTKKFGGNINTDWGFYNFYTYIKLKPNTNIATVESKIQTLFKKYNPNNKNIFYTQALTDIHLKSHLKWELEANGDVLYVKIFGLIAFFLLLIAAINYINLATAKSSLRAKEIGVRKVVGALQNSLIFQFLIESVLIALISGAFALLLAQSFLPILNSLIQKNLTLIAPQNGLILFSFGATVILVGILAGIFPALYLSSFKPIAVLKNMKINQNNVLWLRKGLVIFQFILSVILIVGALIVNNQINYIQNTKLGFNKEQVMIIEGIGGMPSSNSYESFSNELKQMPNVKAIAGANGVIGGLNGTTFMRLKGSQNEQLINLLSVGFNYLDVMSISLKEGRGFSDAFPTDVFNIGKTGTLERESGGIVLNEKAVKELGVTKPFIGKEIQLYKRGDTTYNVKIIGVVKDFHFTSLRSEIKPFAFINVPNNQNLMTVKLGTKEVKNTIAQIEKTWNSYSPDSPFRYYFLDETFEKLYHAENQFKIVFTWLTALSVFIACLGLFALSTFMAEQRVKEIGIRKVLGATVLNITRLLSTDFLKLVLIANGIAFPIAYYCMSKWLQDFAYRIEIKWWIFAITGVSALLIALLTVSYQAIKAALMNPVKSLKSE